MPPDPRDRFDPGIDNGIDDEIQPGTVEVDGVQTEDPDRLRERAAEGTPFRADDVELRDGEVRVRDSARRRVARRRAAAGTPFAPESFDVSDNGSVEAPDPTERVDVTVFDDGVRGNVEIVSERTGERRDLGADAGGEPFFGRIDAPDREGAYRIEIGGETVERFRVGSAGATVDRPGDLGFGFNGTILDADRGDTGVEQSDFDPDDRRTPASADPDVVAGAGAADALQAGADPEALSPLNPIDEAEGERIAEALAQPDAIGEGMSDQQLATRGSEANRRLRERVADEREGVTADDVDLVATSDGLAAQTDGVGPSTVNPRPVDGEELDFGDATPGGTSPGPTAPPPEEAFDDAFRGEGEGGDNPSRGDLRADVNQLGRIQLQRERTREGGETAVDRGIERVEDLFGIDAPGEGDLVQQTETRLSGAATAIRDGETPLPSPAEAEEFGADAAATTAVGDDDTEVRVGDATLDREEAAREFGGAFARETAAAANVPAAILGAGRTAEAVGETGFNLAAGFGARALDDVRLRGLDADTRRALIEAGSDAGDRGRESVEDATRNVAQGAEVTATRVQNNPVDALGTGAFFAGSVAGGTAASTAATRAITRLPDGVRSLRTRRRASDTVDFEDVTNDQGAAGELPNFETPPSAPTSEAVREVEDRAADNPDAVLDAVDEDAAVFQSTEADLGPGFEARRGSSELPGLFTSPDASPLRLDVGESSSLLSTDIRAPRLRDFTSSDDRLAAFPGDRVRGFPEDATGSGRVPDGEGGFEPDPSTSGARFLDEDAEAGTAFVRPQGARTTELEALFPPGSRFRQTDTLAVDLPDGRTVPVDAFRRAEDVTDTADDAGALDRFVADTRGRATLGDDAPGATRTVREIDAELRRLRSRRDELDGEPATPTASSGASGGGSTTLPTSNDLTEAFGSSSTTSTSSTSATSSAGGSSGVFGSSAGATSGGSGSGSGSSTGGSGGTPTFGSEPPTTGGSPTFGGGGTPTEGTPTETVPTTGEPTTGGPPPTTGTPPTTGSPPTIFPEDEDDDEDGLFGLFGGERDFDSGIADGDEAYAALFGDGVDLSGGPERDLSADRTFGDEDALDDFY